MFPRAGRLRSSRLRITTASYFRPDVLVLKKVFSIGLPSAIENLTFNGGKLITQTYIVFLGTDAIAANYIASAIANFLQVPANSLGIAATTLVGQAVGKRDREAARRALSVVVALGALSLLIVGVPCVPLAGALSSLYSRDPEVIRTSASLLRLNAIVSPLIWAVSFIMPAGFRGAGDATFPMAVSMASMWIIRVSLGYVFALPLGMGVLGVWLAMMIDWVARAIFFELRLHSGKWLAKAAI
jgi:Na+-driven multidrug efflux pump